MILPAGHYTPAEFRAACLARGLTPEAAKALEQRMRARTRLLGEAFEQGATTEQLGRLVAGQDPDSTTDEKD